MNTTLHKSADKMNVSPLFELPENVLAVIKRRNVYSWYICEPDIWVLDWEKWDNEFEDIGFPKSDIDLKDRDGI
jgi:hypothetical protein